jgi:hypothetical protein
MIGVLEILLMGLGCGIVFVETVRQNNEKDVQTI